ncbi:MAG TPA: hypothetical protein P5556_04145 [Candidatus Gastranaerophilales bacterium]|nr:hypothetical protein [Candidatus Gastranaerophilales bacterium]
MEYKIYKTVHKQIIKIWQYTKKEWGEEQANNYVWGFMNLLKKFP